MSGYVNWTPIRPNFADLSQEQYRKLLTLYRDLIDNKTQENPS